MPNELQAALLGEVRAEMHRKDPRVTQRMIAEATDSDPATVWRWLTGKTSPRLDALITICSLLGVSLEEIARRAEDSCRVAS